MSSTRGFNKGMAKKNRTYGRRRIDVDISSTWSGLDGDCNYVKNRSSITNVDGWNTGNDIALRNNSDDIGSKSSSGAVGLNYNNDSVIVDNARKKNDGGLRQCYGHERRERRRTYRGECGRVCM